MKVLYILNKSSGINSFSLSSILAAKKLGWNFHIAGNWRYKSESEKEKDEKKYGIKIHHIPFERFPLNLKNINAFIKINKLFYKERYDIIHCNTPIGGIIGRILGIKFKKKVIYQAHGFHFFDGAPKMNWLLFYPIEKWLSKYTDILITINKEDHERAKKKFYAKKIEYIPGVGLDTEKIRNIVIDRKKKRGELGLKEDDIVLLSVGELNKNKNHKIVIDALHDIKNSNVKYLIAGIGNEKVNLENLIKKYQLEDRVKLLGYRTDIYDLCKISDIFIFPSKREGLSLALMEAMACGLPCIVSNIRGNVDLIDENKGGGFINPNKKNELNVFVKLINDQELRLNMGKYNLKKIQNYDIAIVEKKMKKIYSEI